ncbi:5646_t:CDS:1, partial [Paraglomus occultum]
GPLVWTTRGEQIAKSIDINSLDISILNPLGLSMPDESPPPEIVYRKRRGRRRRNIVDVKGKARSTLDQPVRNGRGRPRGSTNKNKVVRVRKTGGTRGRPRKTAILNRSSEASVASASGSKDPAFDQLDRAESVISIEDSVENDADSPIRRNMDTNREIVITSDEDMEVDGVANGKSARNANANGVHKDRIRSVSKALADDNTIGSSGHTDISTTYTSNINNLLNSPLPDFVDGTQSPSSLSVGSIDAASNDKTPVKDSANATETNKIDLFTTIQPPHYKNAGDETTAQTSATGGIPSPVSSADEKLSTPSKVHLRQSTVSTSSGSLSGNLPKKRGRKRKRPIEKSPTDRDENSQGTMNGNVDYSDDNNSDTHSIGYDKSNHTNSRQNLYNSEFPRSGTSSNEGIRGYNPVNGNSRSHYTSERKMNHTAISHRHKSAFSSRSHSATEIREDSPPRKVRRTRAQERPKAVRRTKSQGQSEDKMTTHAKSSLAPVVPQPICVCCAEVQAPDERSTATLV